MTPPRCNCADCRVGDALPVRLQGWPGAYQIPLLHPAIGAAVKPKAPRVLPPRSLDDWNYPGVRDACTERCAEVGDPPCHEMIEQRRGRINADMPMKPCAECWRDVGVEPGDDFDENAAIGRLV